MELREIVESWLEEHGYDGLVYSDIECGCCLGDLMPCGSPGIGCEAGYKKAGITEFDWTIVPGKRG
jgi:hypothetical protein